MPGEADIRALAQSIEDLRRKYDQYFMGIERLPPTKEHEGVGSTVRQIAAVTFNNTALKFQRNNLVARFNTLSMYWTRILRQIEDGTYKRDRLRAERILHQDRQAPPVPGPATISTTAKPEPATTAADPFQSVFQAYLQARAACGQDGKISYQALSEALGKQAQSMKTKYQCSTVLFKVSVEGGKAVIKAVPQK